MSAGKEATGTPQGEKKIKNTEGADAAPTPVVDQYTTFIDSIAAIEEALADGFYSQTKALAKLDEVADAILAAGHQIEKTQRKALGRRVQELRTRITDLGEAVKVVAAVNTEPTPMAGSKAKKAPAAAVESFADLGTEKLVVELEQKITNLETSPSAIMTQETDRLEIDSRDIYAILNLLKNKLPETEYKALELKVLLFDYRMTKRVLHFTLQRIEMSEGAFKNFIGNYKDEVFNTRIYNRVDRLIQRMKSGGYPGVDPLFIDAVNADFNRAKSEAEQRMDVFMTEQSLTNQIWWNGETGETAARGIPGGAGNFFAVYQKTIADIVHPSKKVTTDERLRFAEEAELNIALPRRLEKMHDFKNPEKKITVPLTPTTSGEIMRLLDKLYANKLPGANDFYKTMHITANRVLIPRIIKKAFDAKYADKGITITEEQVKRVFYLHTLFMNHSMLLSGSPNISDTGFYANRLPQYALGETKQGVAGYYLPTLLMFVGKFDADAVSADNPGGRRYIFDIIGRVDTSMLPEPHTAAEYLAKWTTPIQNMSSTSYRRKMHDALHHHHKPGKPKYDFLADAPLVVLHKNDFGSHQFFPLPLQFMVFSDPSATYKLKRPGEIRVKRWQEPGSDKVCKPITAADYVNENGEIMYEMIPWEQVVDKKATLLDWYNQGKNILNFLNLFRAEATEIPPGPKLAKEKKDLKYGAVFVPTLGLEALVGRIDGDKLFDRVLMMRTLGQSLYALQGGSFNNLEHKLTNLSPALDTDDVEAIIVALKAAVGQAESAEEGARLLMEQIENLGRYKN